MNLQIKIEALLYAAGKPLSVKQIAELTGEELEAVKAAGAELENYYRTANRGLVLIDNNDKWQLATHPDTAELVGQLIKEEVAGELTRPSLEALTVIAYRGPISKTELDKIRGVNCAMILRNLLVRGLIESKDSRAGEPLYNVSFDFLKHLGLGSVNELPDFERLNRDESIERAIVGEEALPLNAINEEL